MRVVLRKMGNSRGVIIPRALLAQLGMGADAALEMRIEAGEIRLRPQASHRAGWAAASAAIAAGVEEPAWPEFSDDDPDLRW